jgi:dual-specificity kinase
MFSLLDKILSVIGEGTFGKVVECWDRYLKIRVAIKIIRSIQKYREAAMIEIDVLKTIKKYDPNKEKPLIQLLSYFDYKNHICMVFEKYGLSLYDFLKKNKFKPFKFKHVQEIAKQLLEAIACIFLKKKIFI